MFDPDHVICFVGTDLGQEKFAKRLSADGTSRVRIYEDNPRKWKSQ